MLTVELDRGTNDANHLIDEPENEILIVESSGTSRRIFDPYYSDQKAHLDTLSEIPDAENDGKLFWIFRGIDYKNWIGGNGRAPVLVLRGSHFLESVASHIMRTLKDNKIADLVLHFFYGSTRDMEPPQPLEHDLKFNWWHLSCVWTLLRQVIDGYSPLQQQNLLTVFLSQAFRPISDITTAKVSMNESIVELQHLLGL